METLGQYKIDFIAIMRLLYVNINIFSIQMLSRFIREHGIRVNGILHIGANKCQEHNQYKELVGEDNIFWVEAIPSIVEGIRSSHPSYNIYQALITDKNDSIVRFNISSNDGLSSSIYEFGTHTINHPTITFTEVVELRSITMDNFMKSTLPDKHPNILVLDVQGAELLVLKGGSEMLRHIELIHTEINTGETYIGCSLVSDLDAYLREFNFVKVHQHVWSGHTYGDAVYIKRK